MPTIMEVQDSKCLISNVTGTIGRENDVYVQWDWPKNPEYNRSVVFGMEKEYTLSELLENHIDYRIYMPDIGVRHQEFMNADKKKFKVFAAKQKGTDLIIVNQSQNNESEWFYKKTKVSYDIRYEKIKSFSSYKKCRLTIRNISDIKEEFLYYKVSGYDAIYPIDIHNFHQSQTFEFYLMKNQEADMIIGPGQTGIIELERM